MRSEVEQASAPRAGQIALVAVLGVVLVGIITFFCLTTIVPAFRLRFDFYPRWLGGQAFWRGESPYSQSMTDQIQADMFGGPVAGYQERFVYPAYAAVVLTPFLLLPFPVAVSLWMAIQFIALAATPLVWLRALGWKLPAAAAMALLLGCVLAFRYPINIVLIAQFIGTLLLALTVGFSLLLSGRDTAAGIVLALATIPPPVSGPIVLVVLGVYALKRRPRAFIACAVTLVLLTLISLLRIGWWVPDFLHELTAYPDFGLTVWSPSLIAFAPLRIVLVAAALLMLGVTAWRLRVDSFDRQVDFLVTALIVGVLLLPITGSYYMALLIPPIIACLWRARGKLVLQLGIALVLVTPWLFFAARDAAPALDFLLLPLGIGAIWVALNARQWMQQA